jgi:hypothetical protein
MDLKQLVNEMTALDGERDGVTTAWIMAVANSIGIRCQRDEGGALVLWAGDGGRPREEIMVPMVLFMFCKSTPMII